MLSSSKLYLPRLRRGTRAGRKNDSLASPEIEIKLRSHALDEFRTYCDGMIGHAVYLQYLISMAAPRANWCPQCLSWQGEGIPTERATIPTNEVPVHEHMLEYDECIRAGDVWIFRPLHEDITILLFGCFICGGKLETTTHRVSL